MDPSIYSEQAYTLYQPAWQRRVALNVLDAAPAVLSEEVPLPKGTTQMVVMMKNPDARRVTCDSKLMEDVIAKTTAMKGWKRMYEEQKAKTDTETQKLRDDVDRIRKSYQ